ncbi:hypothetical protein ACL58G_07840 [Massilia sp. GER05]|uniref:hypothetical protein n=1 Tax=Massilia sp. GER05 TaxID=3394605 RepID=UPI003F86EFB6
MNTDDNPFRRVDWPGDQPQPSDDDDEHGMPLQPPRGPGLSADDLELLTLAARALGAVRVEVVEGENWVNLYFADQPPAFSWNPLLHGDDTFNLQVQLRMMIEVDTAWSYAWFNYRKQHTQESHVDQTPGDATKRAVTRAAAEIGRANLQQNA